MPKRIEKIEITGFRGATTPFVLDIDHSKPALLIFGENGTGKSTIVDAIDFISNEKYGSIEDRSPATKKKSIVALGASKSDLLVTIHSDSKIWKANLGTEPQRSGPIGCPKAKILRRHQILKIIAATPKDRYDELKGLISLPGIEKSESALRQEVNSVERQLEQAITARQTAEETLEEQWEAAGSPGANAIEWGLERSKTETTELEAMSSHAKSIMDHLGRATTAHEQFNNAKREFESAEKQSVESTKALDSAKEATESKDSELLGVLNETKRYLDSASTLEICPVCQRPDDLDRLRILVGDRLKALSDLRQLTATVQTRQTAATNKEQLFQQKQGDFLKATNALARELRSSSLEEVTNLAIPWVQYPLLCEEELDPSNVAALTESLTILPLLDTLALSLEQRRESFQREIGSLRTIKVNVNSFQEHKETSEDLQCTLSRLQELHQLVGDTRRAYVEEVFATISSEVDSLYSAIHPNEPLGGFRFFLKPNVSGSVEYTGNFEGETKISPLSYYSESHLDTLGVCLFLALAKHFGNEHTIVVLDDVMTSVDEAHMERFIRMLHDQAANFNQLIIATHYRPWREKYRFARGPGNQIQMIELSPWTHGRGVHATGTKAHDDVLREHAEASPMDPQIVASKAGILLENLLDHIALMYRCKLPHTPSRNYTLGEYIGGISGKLSKALKVAILDSSRNPSHEIPLETILQKIGSHTWIRNEVGCHFNYNGESVSPHDVKKLADDTLVLSEAIICSECGEVPSRKNSGSFFDCRCRRLRLHPLEIPNR